MNKKVAVIGGFDDIRSRDVRFLEEAAKLGSLNVFILADETLKAANGKTPKFIQEERAYFLSSVRYVDQAIVVRKSLPANDLPAMNGGWPAVWAVRERDACEGKKLFCAKNRIIYRVISEATLNTFPPAPTAIEAPASSRKKAIVTGCYDWFHSGHVRFFEEVSELGDLYVVVGHDTNIKLLKGAGHPLFSETERRYMTGAIRFVKQALVSSGHGWMDAEPEIARIRPDIYAVNEDGDKPEKREFCRKTGIEYVVLKRLPKPGLPKRQSTDLRGF